MDEKTRADLKALIDAQKQKSFVPEYRDKATDEEALGLMISKYFEWDGLAVLKVTYAGLEDSNFHTENQTIEGMIKTLEGQANLG